MTLCVFKTDNANERHLIRWTHFKETRTKRLTATQKKQRPLWSQHVADWWAWADAHERPRRWLHISLSRLFLSLCVCVKGSDTAVLSTFQFGPCVEKSCVMLHYVFIYTWTLTETFTMPLGFLHCGASPLLLLFYFSFCSIVCNSGWHEMLLYLLAEGAAVRSCCFVLWICWGCISPVMHNILFFCGIIGCDSVWHFPVIVPCLFLVGGGLQRRHCLNCAPHSQSTLSRNRSQRALQFQAKHKSEDQEQRGGGGEKQPTIYRHFWQCPKGKHSLWFLPHSTFCNPGDVNNLVLQ